MSKNALLTAKADIAAGRRVDQCELVMLFRPDGRVIPGQPQAGFLEIMSEPIAVTGVYIVQRSFCDETIGRYGDPCPPADSSFRSAYI